MAYGENADFHDLQSSAPMAKAAPPTPNTRQGSAAPAGAPLTPFGAPTERPDEPVTEGNPLGAGAGPEVLSSLQGPAPAEVFRADAKALAAFLPGLLRSAERPDAPEGFRRYVRRLRDMQGA